MANVLNTDKKIAVIAALAEGSSIRAIERMTGIHRDTIMRLGVRIGDGCTALLDAKMRNLLCNRLEIDEVWGFVGKKESRLRPGDNPQFGNVWTFCAIDAETKLVPAFRVDSNRSLETTKAFMRDVASRMRNRIQVSTDSLGAYRNAVEAAWGADVDYAQIVKIFGHEDRDEHRYAPPEVIGTEKTVIQAAERNHTAAYASVDSPHARIFKAAGELPRSRGLALRLLQPCAPSQYPALHPGNGGWRRRHILDRG